MSGNKEQSGNALASAQAFAKTMIDKASRIQRFENALDRYADDDIFINSLTMRFNYRGEGGVLVVLRANTPDEDLVGFSEGSDLLDAVHGMVARLENKSIQWREDKYGRGNT